MSSASDWGLRPKTPPGLCPWTPLGDFWPQFPGFVPLRNKFLATPLLLASMGHDGATPCHRYTTLFL